eukprot:4835459-Amphidinium_carterae.1
MAIDGISKFCRTLLCSHALNVSFFLVAAYPKPCKFLHKGLVVYLHWMLSCSRSSTTRMGVGFAAFTFIRTRGKSCGAGAPSHVASGGTPWAQAW